MSQKVTLSIPDMLHEKLEEWRASFNLSKMFQDALTEAIQKKEEFQKRFSDDFDMSDTLKRLKKEKFIWEKNFFKLGTSEGFEWAKKAHYENLLYVLRFTDPYALIADPKMNDYFEKLYQSTELEKYTNSSSVDHEQLFLQGWFKGFQEFWDQVKEKL